MSTFPLTPLARGWLTLENAQTPMHVGALLYFKKPARAGDDWVSELAQNWSQSLEVMHPWNLRLSGVGPLGLRAHWVPDDDLELDYHFRISGLPAPGGERELGELVSRLHGRALDLSRPPWEIHLIEGLYGDRFALYVKVHPSLLDGPGFINALVQRMGESGRQDASAPWTHPAALPSSHSVRSLWPGVLNPLQRRIREALSSRLPWVGLRSAPRSALNVQINGLRRFATQSYAVKRLNKLAEEHAVSTEEILYYLVGSAVRRFFREFNALPNEPLLALVADRSDDNRNLTPLLVSLGTHIASRRKRLREVSNSLRSQRGIAMSRGPERARREAAVDVMPYVLRQLSGIDHRLPPMFNLGIVHYESPIDSVYLGGAKLENVFPMPMLLQGSALAIASLRYGDSIGVGLCGARDTLPRLQRIAVYMERALTEMEEEGLDDE